MISSISPPSPLHTLFPHVKHSIFSLPCYYTPLCQIIIGFPTFRYQGFCFSDTVGHRGFFLFRTPLEAEGFFLFGNRRKPSFFPFSDTEIFLFQIPRFLLVGNRRKPMFPFFGHHRKPMFFLFRKPRCLLQRTPSDTDVFPFSEAAVFASKDTVGHRVFPFSDKNVLIYSGA